MSHLAVLESDYLEVNYQAAKKRLQSAQQEKLEAAAEFLAARAALRQTLEVLWPSPCACGDEQPSAWDNQPPFGYDNSTSSMTQRKS